MCDLAAPASELGSLIDGDGVDERYAIVAAGSRLSILQLTYCGEGPFA